MLLVHEQQHTVARQQLLLILSLQHRQIHKAFWGHKETVRLHLETHASQPIASYTRKEDIIYISSFESMHVFLQSMVYYQDRMFFLQAEYATQILKTEGL